MFNSLIHSDWSVQQSKKWMAAAERNGLGWIVDAPRPVPSDPELVKLIQDWTGGGRTVLAGFDFPIGLPASFEKQIGLDNFPTALFGFWQRRVEGFLQCCGRAEGHFNKKAILSKHLS